MNNLVNKSLTEIIHTLGFANVTEAAKAAHRNRSTLYRWHAKPEDRKNKLIPVLKKAKENKKCPLK